MIFFPLVYINTRTMIFDLRYSEPFFLRYTGNYRPFQMVYRYITENLS